MPYRSYFGVRHRIPSNPILRTTQAAQRARARWEEGQKVAMEKAAAQAVEDKERALEDARRVRQSCFYPAVVVSVYYSCNFYHGSSTYTVRLQISMPLDKRKHSHQNRFRRKCAKSICSHFTLLPSPPPIRAGHDSPLEATHDIYSSIAMNIFCSILVIYTV